MRIVSYNVNGLRSAITKGFKEWLQKENFDVVCLQETKMDISHADPDYFKDLGYISHWHCAEKKGYSGVLILTKEKPDNIIVGCQLKNYDNEGRVIRVDFGDLSIMDCYIPSGSSGEERHNFKMQFLEDFSPWMKSLLKKRNKLIVVGDYNIVHQDMDIHNPERKDLPSGFRPEERTWLDQWFASDFKDAFRVKNPDAREYSWWSYRAGSYQKDKGWRIDYQSITPNLVDNLVNCKHARDIRFSDHCPVIAEYKI